MIVRIEGTIDSWIQVRGGELPADAAARIIDGEDFDEVVQEVLGDMPDSVMSEIPGESWLYEGDMEEIIETVKRFASESLSCRLDNSLLDFKTLIVPVGEYTEEGLEDGLELVVCIKDLANHVGKAATKTIVSMHDKQDKMQRKLNERLFFHPGSPNVHGKRSKKSESRYLWTFMDPWKGYYFSAEKTVTTKPKVTFVFFLLSTSFLAFDELHNADGESVDPIAGIVGYALYLQAVVVGDDVPDLCIDDSSDRGIQRLLIEYSSHEYPKVVYPKG